MADAKQSDKDERARREAFIALGYWPNEVLWKVWNQACDWQAAAPLPELQRITAGDVIRWAGETLKADRRTDSELALAHAIANIANGTVSATPRRLWLWKNFVDGKPEYWAFDNFYPCHPNGDPMTLGEPCGYADFKPSTNGRNDVTEEEQIAATKRAIAKSEVRSTRPLLSSGLFAAATYLQTTTLAMEGHDPYKIGEVQEYFAKQILRKANAALAEEEAFALSATQERKT